MSENVPNLNSIKRYSKSSRLVLEEHSHCEVPAGCGGVVLRWRNPDEERPLRIWIYTPAEINQFLIDGKNPDSSRPLLPLGQHVFGIKLTGVSAESAVLSFAATFDPASPDVRQSATHESAVRIVSEPDDTWRASINEPADAWTQTGFDDSAWIRMVAGSLSQPDWSKGRYQFDKVKESGGVPLAIPSRPRRGNFWPIRGAAKTMSALWIRKAFEIR